MILEYTQTASVRSQRDGLQQRGKEEGLEKMATVRRQKGNINSRMVDRSGGIL